MEEVYKEARFDLYCVKCKHETLAEDQDPCHECLNNPENVYSHKPVNFEGKPGFEDYVAPMPGWGKDEKK